MRLLLDTQIFIWAVSDSKKLSRKARGIMLQASEIRVSAVSIWEVAIKRALGKIQVEPDELVAAIESSGFRALLVTPEHAAAVVRLADHHRDPFDRLLVAQAQYEPLRLLTADKQLARHSELVLPV